MEGAKELPLPFHECPFNGFLIDGRLQQAAVARIFLDSLCLGLSFGLLL